MKPLFLELDKIQDAINNDGFIIGLIIGSFASLAAIAFSHAFYTNKRKK